MPDQLNWGGEMWWDRAPSKDDVMRDRLFPNADEDAARIPSLGTMVDHAKKGDDFLLTRVSLLARLPNVDDQPAWRKFVELYGRHIYATAVRRYGMGDADAQEVVQNVYNTVLRQMRDGKFHYDPKAGMFKGWLHRVTTTRIRDFKRNVKRTVQAPECEPDIDKAVAPVEYAEDWKEYVKTTALEYLKHNVSPEHYQIFDCLVLRNMSGAEVAKLFRKNRAAIYMIRLRCNWKLRELADGLEYMTPMEQMFTRQAFEKQKGARKVAQEGETSGTGL